MALIRPGPTLHMMFMHPSLSHIRHPPLKKSPVLFLLLVSFLLFASEACSTGPSSSDAPKASVPTSGSLSPTPTSLPAGTVLYQADWSHRPLDQTDPGWKVMQGQLVSNSSGTATFTIPYHPTVSDYAVEVRVQMVRSVSPYGGYYAIVTPALPDKDGYQAGIQDLKPPGPRPFGDHPQAQTFLNPSSDMNPGSGIPQDYEPGSGWHIYRVEVRGNEVRLLDNGTQIGRASSQRTAMLSNSPIKFMCVLVILRISELRILTL